MCFSCSTNTKSVIQKYESTSDTIDLSSVTDLDYESYEQYIKPIIKRHLNYNPNALKQSGELAFMAEYINQYPHEFGFYDMKVINKRLNDLLGESYKFIDNCALETPIKALNDDMLVIHGCEAHNCHKVNYDIYIRYDDDVIAVILKDDSTFHFYSEEGKVGFEFYHWFLNYMHLLDLDKRIGTFKNAPIIITK